MTEQMDKPNSNGIESTLTSKCVFALKLFTASSLLLNAVSTVYQTVHQNDYHSKTFQNYPTPRRKLATNGSSNSIPSFVTPLLDELKEREKLFEDTPEEEVKYWFEYTGPLQKYYYRYSKSRGKADYFEGRDDSGVTSSRFVENPGAGFDYQSFYQGKNIPEDELDYRSRLRNNCLSMGAPIRPDVGPGTFWYDLFGVNSGDNDAIMDRCRVLFVMNTVGAGKGNTMLWETQPPAIDSAGPKRWMSEQETAAMHLERNLKEVNAMCASGQIAARVQVLVCEPIPGKWTDWMDSLLINCGGRVRKGKSNTEGNPYDEGIDVEERPSPVQVVVVASADTADTCHDLKSGFMEQRMQDLVLALPHTVKSSDTDANTNKEASFINFDPNIKSTHPDLISTDDHDLYIGIKWSSLITIRTVSSFLQSSADIATAAASPRNTKPLSTASHSATSTKIPTSNFFIPSLVRVSYVSEENNKVAKWRMHGDFFHPAAWEISKDSYAMTWIKDSLSSHNGVSSACGNRSIKEVTSANRRLDEKDEECGQWWVHFTEEQMPTNPEIYASEITPPLVRGGSNFAWMLTESQRRQIAIQHVCRYNSKKGSANNCGQEPQAVIPLGDLESHLVNFMPNTALGKKHENGRRPGYSKGNQLEKDREKVRDRKQLKGQEDIEKALFDYTIYPAALFHKDATIKAARLRDSILSEGESGNENDESIGPKTVMSGYYDVTITKPRAPLPSWCQDMARRGLCSLHADYLRESGDKRCWEACGMLKNWKLI